MKWLYQQALTPPLTTVNLLLPRTGVCLDPPERRGLTRLMLRLLLQGAGGLGNVEFNRRLERLGASLGIGLASDHMSLRLLTLTRSLDDAVGLFLEALLRPDFAGPEFERLRAEMLSSWRAEREESKQMRAQEVYSERLFAGAATGYLQDGTAQGLEQCTLAEVQAQYHRMFTGAEPVLAVLSDLGEADVRARTAQRLEVPRVEADGSPYPWDTFTVPKVSGREVTLIVDEDTNTDEVLLGGFTVAESSGDWHIHRLIALIFGGDMNSRLFREVRGERGYSYGASCWYDTGMGHTPRNFAAPFSLYTFPSVQNTAEAVPLVLRLYEELVEHGVTEAELQLARASLINSNPFRRDTPQKLLGLQVERALYGIEEDDEAKHRAKLEAVGVDDVKQTLRATHHPGNLQIVLLGDPARLEPVARAIPAVARQETVRYP